MYLLYLDDSGSAKNPNESYLVLAGVAVFERQVHWIDRALNELASRYDCENPQSVEFHASEIFSGRRPPWNGLTSKVERKNILVDVLRVLAQSHHSTVAFGCAVHKASFPNHDPMKLAFEELCSRFDLLLKRLYQAGDVQRGMIILDKTTYETSLQEMARNFRVLGTQWNIIRNLADIPLFVDSRASRLVQLADHVAYSIFRRYEHADTSYLDVILHKFDSQDGRIHGLVHKQQFTPNCLCPACMSRRLAGE